MVKRVYDLAGTVWKVAGKAVKVHLNGKMIRMKGFSEYAKLYLPEGVQVVSTTLVGLI
jgi:hypothetical protein